MPRLRTAVFVFPVWLALASSGVRAQQPEPLPSWNEGPGKRGLVDSLDDERLVYSLPVRVLIFSPGRIPLQT